MRSFKVTLTFQRFFLLLPVIFNKDDDNSNNNDNEVFSFFSLHSLSVVGEFILILFSAMSHRQSRRLDPEAITALN